MADRYRSSSIIHFPRRKTAPVEDDYHERMRCNLISLAFILSLFLASCWIINTLVSIPSRDCNFSVRRPCSVNPSADNAAFDGDAF